MSVLRHEYREKIVLIKQKTELLFLRFGDSVSNYLLP
jgi:hypothetical protein